MNDDDMAEIEIEDTRPQRAQEVEDRLQQLRAELEVKGGSMPRWRRRRASTQ
jgi:hypothetical protein